MPQKALLAVFAVLLLAAAATLLVADDDTPLLPDAAPSAASPESAAAALAGSSAAATPVDAANTTDADAGVRAMAATFDQPTARPLPDPPRWRDVRIVDEATGAPVPGALVHWYDDSAWDYLLRQDPTQPDRGELHWHGERLAELAGWRTRSDAEGRVRVTAGENDATTVLAQHGERHGRLHIRDQGVPPVGGHVVELAPDTQLRVRVLDAHGAPVAGVPVTIRARGAKDGEWMHGESLLARSTAPDGIATIVHLPQVRRDWIGKGGPAAGEGGAPALRWHAQLFLPGVADPGVEFDLDAPPRDGVELRLPPHGSLRVRAEFAGRPMPGFRSVWVAHEPGERVRSGAYLRAMVGADGAARVDFLPLGLDFGVSTEAGGGLNGTFAGPRQPGQQIDVVLAPPDDAMLLRGRALRADRSPFVEQALRVRCTGPQLRAHHTVHTDANGCFVAVLGSPRKDNRLDQIVFERFAKGEPTLRANAAARTLRPGVEELGDLVLSEGELLIGGRVVRGDEPYRDPISLRLEREQAADGKRAAHWQRVGDQLVHREPDGTFAIRGVTTPGRHRLVATGERLLPIEPIPVAIGARDVVVAVDAGSSLAASAILPEDAPYQSVTMVLVPANAPATPDAAQRERFTRPVGDEHRRGRCDVRWPSVPPGVYTLEVRLWAQTKPLLVIDEVVLPQPAGGDARLVDIDVRPLARVVTVEAKRPDGHPVEDGDGVVFVGPPTSGDWIGFHTWGPVAHAMVPHGPYDLTVCVRGYRPFPLRGDSAKPVARLDPWPTLTVHVPGVPQLPPRTRVHVTASSQQRSEGAYRTQWSSGSRDEFCNAPRHPVPVTDGKASVAIDEGLLTLQVSMTANRRSHTLAGIAPTQVLSTAGEVTITVPAEEWTKALAAVAQPPGTPPK